MGFRGAGAAVMLASGLLLNLSDEKLHGFRKVVAKTKELLDIQHAQLQEDMANIAAKKIEYSCQ
jgi:hypothetical protein